MCRRERRQLTRTTADVFRLVPFIIIVVSHHPESTGADTPLWRLVA